ncbi:hypothetical protein GC250_10210 [Sulfolobus metallicus DSM 6482 = JCM 9184]|uniref:Uncharacterized protein n=1 Tax=Sulfuracidifex metallicus DSM 6482 = JCM 9184 TaxID=523847 RepID=A0A6A9QLD0_SULME|nr:hypothetical protein [Sulfuracidifex metallicus DSM 6482 = JCM 9184]
MLISAQAMNRGLTIVTKDTDFLRVREELHDLKLIMPMDALFLATSVKNSLSYPYAKQNKGIEMLESILRFGHCISMVRKQGVTLHKPISLNSLISFKFSSNPTSGDTIVINVSKIPYRCSMASLEVTMILEEMIKKRG